MRECGRGCGGERGRGGGGGEVCEIKAGLGLNYNSSRCLPNMI